MPDFTFQATGDGRVFISWRGRVVTTLRGAAAARFLERAAAATAADATAAGSTATGSTATGATDAGTNEALQLLMARATRNFKRGNEGGGA